MRAKERVLLEANGILFPPQSPAEVSAASSLAPKPMFFGEPHNERAFQYYGNLQRVKEYVEEHYSEAITLEQISQVACLEAKYFSRFFHKRVGITFTSWLGYIRINEALRRIRASDSSISQIACEVGFGDLRTFERAFKKFTCRTPREFRHLVRP